MASLACELDDVLDRLASEAAAGTITAVRGASLVDLTAALWSGVDRVRAVAIHATGELNGSGDLLGAGFVSTRTWLKKVVGLSPGDAAAAMAQARAVRHDFTATWEAWNGRLISGASARVITSGLTATFRGVPAAQRRTGLPIAEEILLGVAAAGTVADVTRVLSTITATIDPDDGAAAALAAFDDQSLSCTQVGSMFTLTGYLTKEAAATLVTALDLIIDGWYRSGALLPEDQPSRAVDRDERTRSRRRPHLMALALAELARRQLENGNLGSRHEARPHVTLVADVADLAAGLPGELLVPGHSEPALLPAESVRRILCDADVTTVVTALATGDTVTGADGVVSASSISAPDLSEWLRAESRTVLYVGRTRRTAPARLRTALAVRDRHCAFTDCEVDVSRCEAHHVRYWRHHGETALDNMCLLCTKHHHLVHEGGWAISNNPDIDPGRASYWTFAPPVRRITP